MKPNDVKPKTKSISFTVFFMAFALAANSVSAQTLSEHVQGLVTLTQINIVIENIGPTAEDLGVSVDHIKSQAVVLLRNKVPKLQISESAQDTLYIDVHLSAGKIFGQKTDFYGMVQLKVFRLATVVASKMTGKVIVWDTRGILTGPLSHAQFGVDEALDVLITEFAANWSQANP